MSKSSYSRLERIVEARNEELLRQQEFQPANAFTAKEQTAAAANKRRIQSAVSYDAFVNYYFPPEAHKQGYFKPGRLQSAIPAIAQSQGFHVVLGPRGYGKTVTAIMSVCWLMLNGRLQFLGTYSETLDKARALIRTISQIVTMNPRIAYDYAISVEADNANEFRFRISGIKGAFVVKPYSPERSVRGAVQVFDRVEFLLCDDVETMTSSLEPEIVNNRIKSFEEAFHSLADGGSMLILGNNFNEDCGLNQYLLKQDQGKQDPGHFVYLFPAWDDVHGGLWPERYPAANEEELQELHQAGEEEWSGDYQQRPERKGGYLFTKDHWQEYYELPEDAVGVAYCDPNLALRTDISDTTAMGALLYSPTLNMFFAHSVRCLPFSNADELLSAYLSCWEPKRVAVMAFDGNVNQEAVWTNFVLNWCHRHKKPFPPIDYRKYDVDLHAKSVQVVWSQDRIAFPVGFRDTQEGERVYKQITRFKGKKRKTRSQKVDAADWLICAFQVLHDPEVGLGEFNSREIHVTGNYDSQFNW